MEQILKLQLFVSLAWHPLCYFVDLGFPNYDQSMDREKIGFLDHTMRWDSTFYIENALNGYQFEKNHAFLPGFISIISMLHSIAQKYYLHIVLVCIEVANLVSVCLLYKTTLLVTKNVKYTQLTCILFIFNPGSVFFHSVYTESFYTALTFAGIHTYYKYHDRYAMGILLSAVLFSLSTLIRSTGVLYIVVSGFPILRSAQQNLCALRFGSFLKRVIVVHMPLALLVIVIFLVPYSAIIAHPYTLYCLGGVHQIAPPWCDTLIPNIYPYIQDKHWQVGFLTSYQPRRAIFIFWGMFGVVVGGIGLQRRLRACKTWKIIWSNATTPLLLYQVVVYLIFSLIAHVNCSSRFLSSTMMFYWCLADILQKTHSTFSKLQVFTLFYLVYFNVAGIIQFTNFLIWA